MLNFIKQNDDVVNKQ